MKISFEKASQPLRNFKGEPVPRFDYQEVLNRARALSAEKRKSNKTEGNGPQSAQELGKNEMTDLLESH